MMIFSNSRSNKSSSHSFRIVFIIFIQIIKLTIKTYMIGFILHQYLIYISFPRFWLLVFVIIISQYVEDNEQADVGLYASKISSLVIFYQ